MEKTVFDNSVKSLSMDNEAYYRNQAACYRSSPAYNRMKRLYPLLQNHIEYCRDEELVK